MESFETGFPRFRHRRKDALAGSSFTLTNRRPSKSLTFIRAASGALRQSLNTLVRFADLSMLLGNRFPDIVGQVQTEGLLIFRNCGFFATLTLGQNRMRISSENGGL